MPTDPSRWEVMDDATAEMMRQKTPEQRLAIAFGMWDFAKGMIRAVLRAEHPDWTDEQINRETARRISHGAV
jgi:hypothetical protein